MTISELIELLQRAEDEYGDVPVETERGVEVFSLTAVYETGKGVRKTGPIGVIDQKVYAVKIQ